VTVNDSRESRSTVVARRLVEQQQRWILEFARGRVKILAGGYVPLVDRNNSGLELLAVALAEGAEQVPVGGRHEGHAQALALDDQPHGNTLHAAGRQLGPHLAPQQRRHLVAVETIDDPPRFLCPHQVFVHGAGVFGGCFDRLFRDLMKHQPMDGHFRRGLLKCQLMASPSRSSSVARNSSLASFNKPLSLRTWAVLPGGMI
jgi:hypothetical protein